jgi:leucyl aminopeptidase
MQIRVELKPVEELEADALVVFAFDKTGPESGLPPVARSVNDLNGGWIEELHRTGEFSGKPSESALLHRPAGLKAKRVLLMGAGKRDKFAAADLRNLAGAAARQLRSKAAHVAFSLVAGTEQEAVAVVEGAILGDYEPDRYKTEKKDSRPIELVTVAAEAALEPAVRRAQIIAEAQNFARELAGEPANRMTPSVLADRAREMGNLFGVACEVVEQERMRELGMGALLGVAQGSSEPPALIILRYVPFEEPSSKAHLALVGKAVTFDSGGISIKPSENMDKMKYDMSGGAAVIGAMRAIAQLKPSIMVTAFIPAVENMPGGRAQRPGDIVTTLSGKTVEVLNTDAEGRLILADAITYARQLGATHLVDAATLTGAIVVALGHINTGVFSNDEALLGKVLAAARDEGEKMWAMPLDEDYKELLKTPFADLPNIGTRWGGAVTAAMFLKEFADPAPWVHLDIAGTAYLEDSKPHLAKGPAGVPVRTFVNLAVNWKD